MSYKEVARLGCPIHQLDEPFKQIFRVMRPRSGLRMVLDGKNRKRFVTQTCYGVVVQVDVRDLDLGRKRTGVNGKSMIVRSDLDLAGREVFDRLVSAAVPELEFVSFAAERRADQLMPETNTKDRRFCFS